MIEHINTVYRIEHIDSGLGPFQQGLSETTKTLLCEYWDSVKNIFSKFPPPTEEPVILENTNIPKNLKYKFACLREDDIYDWFGSKAIASLHKEGFVIREYNRGIDFDHLILGTNQVVIFLF